MNGSHDTRAQTRRQGNVASGGKAAKPEKTVKGTLCNRGVRTALRKLEACANERGAVAFEHLMYRAQFAIGNRYTKVPEAGFLVPFQPTRRVIPDIGRTFCRIDANVHPSFAKFNTGRRGRLPLNHEFNRKKRTELINTVLAPFFFQNPLPVDSFWTGHFEGSFLVLTVEKWFSRADDAFRFAENSDVQGNCEDCELTVYTN